MSAEISWVFEASVKPDELDEYRKLATEISADNEASEPGQLNFEWYAGGGDVHIFWAWLQPALLRNAGRLRQALTCGSAGPLARSPAGH